MQAYALAAIEQQSERKPPLLVRCQNDIIDAITAYGDARADQDVNNAHPTSHDRLADCIRMIREALAERPAQQELVAIHQFRKHGCSDWYDGVPDHHDCQGQYDVRALYTSPANQAKPLSEEQINEAYGAAKVQHDHIPHDDVVRIARAIESAHGIN